MRKDKKLKRDVGIQGPLNQSDFLKGGVGIHGPLNRSEFLKVGVGVQSKAADVVSKRPMFGRKWPMSKRPMLS